MSSLKRKAAPGLTGNDPKKPKVNASITSFFGQPKPPKGTVSTTAKSSSTPELPTIKFDKAKWVAGLTDDQKRLLKLEIDTLDESWLAHLKDEIVSKDFLSLKTFLEKEATAGKKVFPPPEDVYTWSRHTPFNNIKVVIVGQDPYHNNNQAHGLAFSVRPPTPAPPSLKNIFIALKNDYPSFVAPSNKGGLLTPWADRGVLLLNTCLTVRAHDANSHSQKGWERFTQKVIDIVAARRNKGVVFMAWGTPAGKRVQKIDAKKHLILKSVHPSPLSAARGFFNCGHFKQGNEWLVTRYGAGEDIDWSLGTTPPSSKNGAIAGTGAMTEVDAPKRPARRSPVIEAALAATGAAAARASLSPPSSQEEAYLALAVGDETPSSSPSKGNAMGPPPTPSSRKGRSLGEAGKENESVDV